MALIPIDQVNPSNSQAQSTAQNPGLFGDIYSQPQGQAQSSTQQVTQEQNPLNIGQSFVSGLPRTMQGKIQAIKNMNLPFVKDVSVGEDGKTMLINGQPFEDMDISNPMSVVKGLSRFVGHNTALLGQAAALALAPQTGGMSELAAQSVLSAAGSAVGSYVGQQGAQSVSGEKPDPSETIGQGIIGAVAPGLGTVAEKGIGLAAGGLRAMQKPTEQLVTKLGDSFPEIAETLLGINRGDAQHILDTVKEGRSLKTAFTPAVADVGVPNQLANRVFYGGDNANNTIDNFISTYKNHIANATNKEDIGLIDNIYQDTHKLSPQTLDAMKKFSPDLLTSPTYTADDAYRTLAERTGKILGVAQEEKFNTAYATEIGALYKAGAKSTLQLKDDLGNLMKGLGPISENNPNGVGALLSDGTLNPNYGSRQEREALGNLMSLFKEQGGLANFSVKGGQINTLDMLGAKAGSQMTVNGVPYDSSRIGQFFNSIPASQAYEIMKYAKGPLNTIFKLGGESTVPIQQFVTGINAKLGQLSPGLAQLDKEYANFSGLRKIFGDIRTGNFQSQTQAINTVKTAFTDETTKSAVSDLDNLLKTQILPEIQKIGAANEIKGIGQKGFDGAKLSFMGKLRGINNLRDPRIDEIRQQLDSFDSAIKPKFLQDAKDHAAASEFANKPQSFFKSKYLGMLLGGGSFVAGAGTIGALGALGLGMTVSNPRNVLGVLTATQDILQRNVIPKAVEKVGSGISSKRGTLLLSQLMRKKQ